MGYDLSNFRYPDEDLLVLINAYILGTYEYFAGSPVVLTSFIPFFAFKDLSVVIGSKVILDLFLKRKPSVS